MIKILFWGVMTLFALYAIGVVVVMYYAPEPDESWPTVEDDGQW